MCQEATTTETEFLTAKLNNIRSLLETTIV